MLSLKPITPVIIKKKTFDDNLHTLKCGYY